MWGSIHRLHEIGLNVICIVADGAKQTVHKGPLTQGGDKEYGIVYKARNIYNPTMFVYFMSDVPHLIKTTTNCWLCSQFGGVHCLWVCKPPTINYVCTHTYIHNHVGFLKWSGENPVYTHRYLHKHTHDTKCSCKVRNSMQINGKHILWAHLHQLYDKRQAESGLYIGNKLRHEHLSLTLYILQDECAIGSSGTLSLTHK